MAKKPARDWGALRASLDGALNDPGHPKFKVAEWIIMVCTVASVLVTILSTVPSLARFHRPFLVIEVLCALLFMVEYAARLALSPNRRAYAFSLWGFVDLMSFLPIFFVLVPLSAVIFAQQLKILLVFRSLRIAKLARAYVLEKRLSLGADGKAEDVKPELHVSVYFLTLISSSILNGAVMYALEGKQHHYSTMPLAILEVVKIFMATVPHPANTTVGELFVLFIRFQGLCLLGLLIDVMGGFMRRMLFGHSK
jgi:voltage-gated potassium channel